MVVVFAYTFSLEPVRGEQVEAISRAWEAVLCFVFIAFQLACVPAIVGLMSRYRRLSRTQSSEALLPLASMLYRRVFALAGANIACVPRRAAPRHAVQCRAVQI